MFKKYFLIRLKISRYNFFFEKITRDGRGGVIFLIFTAFCLICFSGCGRKQKHIFYFSEEKPLPKMSKLSLPLVKGLEVKKEGDTCVLSWFAMNTADLSEKKLSFLGYNVYRLVNAYFVPKKPLNKKVITKNFFVDSQITSTEHLKKQEQYCYVVRAVFSFYKQKVEGPASQVVCV